MPHTITREVRECIENCTECHTVCSETIAHCLELGGKHAKPDHIGLLKDCALICITSANFMISMSKFHPRICDLCAEICEACAQDCEKVGNGDELMQQCAEICRRCAESCRQMARATVR